MFWQVSGHTWYQVGMSAIFLRRTSLQAMSKWGKLLFLLEASQTSCESCESLTIFFKKALINYIENMGILGVWILLHCQCYTAKKYTKILNNIYRHSSQIPAWTISALRGGSKKLFVVVWVLWWLFIHLFVRTHSLVKKKLVGFKKVKEEGENIL